MNHAPGGELGLQVPGRVRFLLARSREGVWLAIGRSRTVAEVVATLQAPGQGEAGGGVHTRPPGHEDPTELDIRIMAEVFELRRARMSGSAEDPVREDEYHGWRDRAPGLPVVHAPGSRSSTARL